MSGTVKKRREKISNYKTFHHLFLAIEITRLTMNVPTPLFETKKSKQIEQMKMSGRWNYGRESLAGAF